MWNSHRDLHGKKYQTTIVQKHICYKRAASVLKFLACCTQEQQRGALTTKVAVRWNQKRVPTDSMGVAGIAGTADIKCRCSVRHCGHPKMAKAGMSTIGRLSTVKCEW